MYLRRIRPLSCHFSTLPHTSQCSQPIPVYSLSPQSYCTRIAPACRLSAHSSSTRYTRLHLHRLSALLRTSYPGSLLSRLPLTLLLLVCLCRSFVRVSNAQRRFQWGRHRCRGCHVFHRFATSLGSNVPGSCHRSTCLRHASSHLSNPPRIAGLFGRLHCCLSHSGRCWKIGCGITALSHSELHFKTSLGIRDPCFGKHIGLTHETHPGSSDPPHRCRLLPL